MLLRYFTSKALINTSDKFADVRKDLRTPFEKATATSIDQLSTDVTASIALYNNEHRKKSEKGSNSNNTENASAKLVKGKGKVFKNTTPKIGFTTRPSSGKRNPPPGWTKPTKVGTKNWECNITCSNHGRYVHHTPSECHRNQDQTETAGNCNHDYDDETETQPKKKGKGADGKAITENTRRVCAGCGNDQHRGLCPEIIEQLRAELARGITVNTKPKFVTLGEALYLGNAIGKTVRIQPRKDINGDVIMDDAPASAKSTKLGDNRDRTMNANLDSGASNNISGVATEFEHLILDSHTGASVTVADDRTIPIDGVGTFNFPQGSLHKQMHGAYFIKGWGETLVSVSPMIDNTNDIIIFNGDGAYYQESDTGTMHKIAVNINHSYRILKSPYTVNSSKPNFTGHRGEIGKRSGTDIDDEVSSHPQSNSKKKGRHYTEAELEGLGLRIHKRFGHLNPRLLLATINGEHLDDVKPIPHSCFDSFNNKDAVFDSNEHDLPNNCLVCSLVKITQRKIGSTLKPAINPLERIRTDTKQLPCKGLNGEMYYVFVIDEHTRKKWVRFVSSKEHVTTTMQNLIIEMEREIEKQQHKVKVIRSDQGTELGSTEFQTWLQ
jgi:hypothetical protein